MSKKKGSTSSAILLISLVILAGLIFYGQLFEEDGLLIKGKTNSCKEYLSKADSLFAINQFDKALSTYQNVLDCKPNDRYVNAQIRECTENLDDTFQHTFGGKKRDEGRSIVAAHGGGYVIAANTESFGNGGMDIHLMKLDRLGHLDWRRNYGGIRDEKVNDLLATRDGGYLAVGSTQTYGKGEEDIWLLKLNGSGRKQWAKSYGGAKQDVGLRLKELKDGNFAIAGFTQSKGIGKGDAWILKVDENGTVLWEKTMGGEDWEVAMDLLESSPNHLVIAGYSQSFNENQVADGWLAKMDTAEDSVLWTQTFGGDQTDLFTNILPSKNGNFVLAGNTKSFGNGLEDAWLMEVDGEANKVWQKTVGGKNKDLIHRLLQTSNGNYTVIGQTASAGAGAEDAWVFGVNKNGRFLWKNELGSPQMDIGTAIIETNDKGYVMVGATPSDKGDLEIWVLHLDERGKDTDEQLQ